MQAVAAAVDTVEENRGFRRERKLYTLEFSGEFDGMITRVRPLRYGDMISGGVTMDWATPSTPRVEWLSGLRATSEAFASVLVEWNILDDADRPVPPTFDGLCSLDEDQAVAIVMVWAVKLLGISVPLEQTSDGGDPSLVASMPMETVSPSLAS